MLKITLRKLNDVAILACAGRIVLGNAERLTDVVHAQLPASSVWLDFTEVRDVDASGLGALASLHTAFRAAGKRLKLLNVRPQVAQLLRLTKLDSVIETCSVREILDLFCASAAVMRQHEIGRAVGLSA